MIIKILCPNRLLSRSNLEARPKAALPYQQGVRCTSSLEAGRMLYEGRRHSGRSLHCPSM